MTQTQKFFLFLSRLALGFLFLYAGVTKLMNPAWSAAGYLKSAHNFMGFYAWLTQPGIMPVVNFVNEWGLTLLGISLILGIGVRLGSFLGAILMLLYYLVLPWPHQSATAFIVDEHIVYGLVLFFFASSRAGRTWGLDGWLSRFSPAWRKWMG